MATPLLAEDIVRVDVRGSASGQAIDNVLHYVETLGGGTGVTLEDMLTAFRAQWRALVCPAVSDSYSVLEYKAAVYAKALIVKNPGPNEKAVVRYTAATALDGDALDDGQIAGAALPTYAAANFRKNSQGPQSTFYSSVNVDPNAFFREKIFKGSTRIGPLPETFTEIADQNDLTAAAEALLVLIGGLIDGFAFVVGGGGMTFAGFIPSLYQDKLVRRILPPTVSPTLGSLAGQVISTVTLSPLISSQVSRKQRSPAA